MRPTPPHWWHTPLATTTEYDKEKGRERRERRGQGIGVLNFILYEQFF